MELGSENRNGYSKKGILCDNEDTSLDHKLVRDDGWVADSNIVVIDHIVVNECAGLHGVETIHDEHLKEAGREADEPEVKQQDGQDLVDDSKTEHYAQQREEAEQVVHGLMQRGLQQMVIRRMVLAP